MEFLEYISDGAFVINIWKNKLYSIIIAIEYWIKLRVWYESNAIFQKTPNYNKKTAQWNTLYNTHQAYDRFHLVVYLSLLSLPSFRLLFFLNHHSTDYTVIQCEEKNCNYWIWRTGNFIHFPCWFVFSIVRTFYSCVCVW